MLGRFAKKGLGSQRALRARPAKLVARSALSFREHERAAALSTLAELRHEREGDIESLAEVVETRKMIQQLRAAAAAAAPGQGSAAPAAAAASSAATMSRDEYMTCMKAALATQLLHTEARTASLLGEGFYTIGPCGEEMLAGVGLALEQTDPMALHYRHLATQIARQLGPGQERPIDDILLDRARGFTVSKLDPVTGGLHCAIGGGAHDYVVTSTLASQCPPAVGRALGIGLVNGLDQTESKYHRSNVASKPISYVSLGDGSVNNAHFLSAANMAEYAKHRRMQCPVLFGISDNRLCISLRNYGWLKVFLQRFQFPVFEADANDLFAVHSKTQEAAAYCRENQAPAAILFKNVSRRFGHAATDRQAAYMPQTEIEALQKKNVVLKGCVQGVNMNLATYTELADLTEELWGSCKAAFNVAATEPKHNSRSELVARLRPADQWANPSDKSNVVQVPWDYAQVVEAGRQRGANRGKDLMRKSMNRVVIETLEKHPEAIYVGEDVRHGGYYSVTDQAAELFKSRVQDFPPDETSLVGAALGYAQVGLLPICEIPYAKYLDCAADMFFETVFMNWLNAKPPKEHGAPKQQPAGVFFRLQGFGRGVFGGNFHTHNIVHLPPGLDVVCFSNGRDYAQGFRHGIDKVRDGHMVMSVDCTHLLNLRHVDDRDNAWMTEFPSSDIDGGDGSYSFDQVTEYIQPGVKPNVVVVSYGDGVVAALQAKRQLEENHGVTVSVVDSPLLSRVPQGLESVLKRHAGSIDGVVFADICKEGQHPFGGMTSKLHSEGKLDRLPWTCIAATPTYNPLGCTVTFLSAEDIVNAALKLHKPEHN